jgi:uncharacterized cupredoxin-like copper-binding protein
VRLPRTLLIPAAPQSAAVPTDAVAPGQTKERARTFDTSGTRYAGRHVPGHNQAGMNATIVVE